MPLLLTREEVARELGVGRVVVERVMSELPIVRLGPRTRRVSVESLAEWIRRQEGPATKGAGR